MKLPEFGKKIAGTSVNHISWKPSPWPIRGIDFEIDINLHWSSGSLQRQIVRSWLSTPKVEDMAKALGLIPEPTPAKPGLKTGEFHKVCKNGHKKPYAGRCQVCEYVRGKIILEQE